MTISDVKVLEDKDWEFIAALRSLDVPENVAVLITYLANVKEASGREIEMGADLPQPQVSIGMKILRANNWLNEREVKRAKKGRPQKIYALKASIDEIIKHLEKEKLQESVQAMNYIKRLKELDPS